MNGLILNNGTLTATFTPKGRLVSLVNSAVASHSVLSSDTLLDAFRMTLQLGDCKETMIHGDYQSPTVTVDSTKITLAYDRLEAFDGVHRFSVDIGLTLTATLHGDHIVFDAHIDNCSGGRILDFTYPIVGKLDKFNDTPLALLLPYTVGQRYQNIGALLGQGESRENGANSIAATYPGIASMSWMAVTDDKSTLALTSHDPDFSPRNYVRRERQVVAK